MSLFYRAAELERSRKAFALVSITSTSGSAPRTRGHMIIQPGGDAEGTVGGGPAEKLVISEALEALLSGRSRQVHYTLDNGGTMDFFIEVFPGGTSLFLVGAGHVNQAVSRLADFLMIPYSVADSRSGFASETAYPGAAERLEGQPVPALITEADTRGLITRHTVIVIATYNHDVTALEAALGTKSAFIGLLGSRKKVIQFTEKMREAGFTESDLKRIHAPVGLDLGAETPEEIAVSILSEVMMNRRETTGASLSLHNKANKNLN